MSRMLAILLAAGVALAAAPADAQTSQDERARLHFESGRSYFEEGAYERALQEFRQAYELSPRTTMLFNMGTTMERLGLWDEAADTFQRYLDESPAAENRPTLERRVTNLRRRAERHAQDDGQGDDTGDQDAGGTDTGGQDAGGTAPGDTGGGEGLVIGGAVALGVGGVGLVAFGILGGLAMSEQGAVESGCFASGTCTPSDVAAMDDLAMGADVALIAGSVVAAAGVVLLVLGLMADEGSSDVSLFVVPVMGPETAGLNAFGSF